jgi:hypothetical protein
MKNIKNIAKKIPPLKRIVDERNNFANENEILYQKINDLQVNNNELRISNERIQKKYLFHQKEQLLLDVASLKSNIAAYFNEDSESLKDHAFINLAEDQHIVAYVPIELLFTETIESATSKIENVTEQWEYQNSIWADLNIIRLKPHRDLFYFFKGIVSSPQSYLDWFNEIFTSRGIELIPTYELIDNRYREFQFMSDELNKGLEFFINNPINVVWNERGYFNLLDGHHRAMFLYCAGIRFLPTKISAEDYSKWKNKQLAVECAKLITIQNRNEFYTPINNPYFLDKKALRDTVYKTRLDHILEFFSSHRFSNYKIIDIGSNLGYYTQYFCKEGAIVTSLEPDPQHYDLSKILCKLLHTNPTILEDKVQEFDATQKFDVAIFLTVFYHFFDEIREGIIRNIDLMVNKFIIWESGDNAQMEIDYITKNSKFHYYKKIANTYGTAKIRELGIFSIEEF